MQSMKCSWATEPAAQWASRCHKSRMCPCYEGTRYDPRWCAQNQSWVLAAATTISPPSLSCLPVFPMLCQFSCSCCHLSPCLLATQQECRCTRPNDPLTHEDRAAAVSAKAELLASQQLAGRCQAARGMRFGKSSP